MDPAEKRESSEALLTVETTFGPTLVPVMDRDDEAEDEELDPA